MKALVGAFNQEKALVGAFSVIVQPVVEPMDRFTALFHINQQLSCNKELKKQPEAAETLLSIYVSCGLKLFPSFLVKVLYEFDFSKG